MSGMTPSEAMAIAKAAYIFTYPLVASCRVMREEALGPSSNSYSGGFGVWLSQPTPTAAERPRTTTPTATLRSSAWLDLRREPWVLSAPSFESEYSGNTRALDLWTFLIAETQTCQRKDPAGCKTLLLASPNWLGEVPDNVERVVRGESVFVHCEAVISCDGRGNDTRLADIQSQHALRPLSLHLGRSSEGCARYPQASIPAVQEGTHHWSSVNAALALTKPNDQDRAILQRLAEIGIVAGEPWDANEFSAEILEAIDDGTDAAISDLMRAAGASEAPSSPRSRADTDRDYFGRALAAFRAIPILPV